MTHSTIDTETPGWIAALEQADETIWLSDDVPLMFREIVRSDEKPLPEFWMGSRDFYEDEEPRHRVRLKQPFYISTFPVTQHQWRTLIDQSTGTELDPDPSHFKGNFHPVEQISWDDAAAWCPLLDRCEPLRRVQGDCRTGLPTEAQWEYACRSGTETEYHSGDGEAALNEVGWYDGNAKGSTQPVGKLDPNGFGLFDMHGNVWEWCRDLWDEHAYKHRVDGVCDPEVTESNSANRVTRGGGWIDSPRLCRAGFRDRWAPGLRFGIQGFRVCLFPGPDGIQ